MIVRLALVALVVLGAYRSVPPETVIPGDDYDVLVSDRVLTAAEVCDFCRYGAHRPCIDRGDNSQSCDPCVGTPG